MLEMFLVSSELAPLQLGINTLRIRGFEFKGQPNLRRTQYFYLYG